MASRGVGRRRDRVELARGAARHEVGEHRDRDLGVVDGPEVEPGRRVHPRELLVARRPGRAAARASTTARFSAATTPM